VIDQSGEVLANRNVPNGVEPIGGVPGGLPRGTPVAFEAAFGWRWLVELLQGYGFAPHLVHPLRCKAIASARLKNDKVDAAILAQLLRADLLPEARIAPPPLRQLRALLRHRVQLVRLRTLLHNRIHAVLADHGHDRPGGCWSGPGWAWLASLHLPAVSREVVARSAMNQPSASSAEAGSPTMTPGCGGAGSIHYYLAQARIADLHRQAQRDALARAASQARRARTQRRRHPVGALPGVMARRVLTLLSGGSP
jgi:hypothetical protein